MALASIGSQAGRPLAVDDANVNDASAGHVETYYQRLPGSINAWTVAPAYGITDGVEIATAFSRDNTAGVDTSSVQIKFRITPAKKDGCNFGTSFGLSRANVAGTDASKFINGLMSCNLDEAGAVHVNLGLVVPPVGASVTGWGVAYEREFGPLTGHIEAFGADGVWPTIQMGLRTMLTKTLQLDGTVGSSNGESLYSLGLKFLF